MKINGVSRKDRMLFFRATSEVEKQIVKESKKLRIRKSDYIRLAVEEKIRNGAEKDGNGYIG